jgi:hypothetical protein
MPYLLYLQEPPGKMLKMIYMRRNLVGKGWLGVKRLRGRGDRDGYR